MISNAINVNYTFNTKHSFIIIKVFFKYNSGSTNFFNGVFIRAVYKSHRLINFVFLNNPGLYLLLNTKTTIMLRTLIAIVVIHAFANLSFAQIRATTESGNKVLLFDNGTWQYEEQLINAAEKSTLTAKAVAVATLDVDSSKTFATDPEDLFFLPSPRLVRYFGESGGHIRCKLSCSNNLGIVKVHFMWEFPVSDGYRYFGSFKEGSKVTFTMDDGQKVELVMGDESSLRRLDNKNYSVISNASQPLTKTQIAALCAQPFRKMEVGWKKNPEEYDIELTRFLMDTLPTVL